MRDKVPLFMWTPQKLSKWVSHEKSHEIQKNWSYVHSQSSRAARRPDPINFETSRKHTNHNSSQPYESVRSGNSSDAEICFAEHYRRFWTHWVTTWSLWFRAGLRWMVLLVHKMILLRTTCAVKFVFFTCTKQTKCSESCVSSTLFSPYPPGVTA